VATTLETSSKALSKELPVVLAVDDSPVQLRLIQETLGRNGYTVKTATSGEKALEIMRGSVPAVVVSDVTMTGMNGYDLCKAIKKDSKLSNVPVILLTSEGAPKDFKAGREAGAVVYITKPFKPEGLLNAVRMVCPVQHA
jgi:CheY-like chemotaxis protein